ncbi:MAG: cytochrome-c peroxidase [Planctomycetota bacterium]
MKGAVLMLAGLLVGIAIGAFAFSSKKPSPEASTSRTTPPLASEQQVAKPASAEKPAEADESKWKELPGFIGPLRPVKAPADNPTTDEKIELGRMLYFDPRLSGNGALSCASCHNPGLGWSDGLAKGIGFQHGELPRSSPTVLNAAYYKSQFWDGREPTLEMQAKGPMTAAKEMNSTAEKVTAVVNSIPKYKEMLTKIYGEANFESVAKAIAAFERIVVDQDSPFDRYVRGDENAIGESAKRGLDIFTGKGKCTSCHNGPNFSDDKFHNIGVGDADRGRFEITKKDEDLKAFRTPTLRNIALTGPYMHDGSQKTLRETIEHYERIPKEKEKHPNLSALMLDLTLTEQEKQDLEAFLHTLTGDKRDPRINVIPDLPPAASAK